MNGTATVALTIDGRAVRAAEGTNVLKAAEGAGIEIPHFCYHPAFEAEGSCRMCLVEIEGLPKLELACSTAVREGMVVRTTTPRVLEARKDILGFFLAEHPLDCPICDKAGECLLQDHYDRHGRFPGRFLEAKEKRGKLVAIGRDLVLDRERCILCTRCVRFLRKVTETGELGVFERGVRSEIGTYDDAFVDNDYSGNLVDICPVGAITHRDFRFKTRAWFLDKRPTVCPRCSRGCAVTIESVSGYPLGPRDRRVFRIRARENPAVNGHWICDLGRAGRSDVDATRRTRVARREAAGKEITWQSAAAELAERIREIPGPGRGERMAVVLTSFMTCEELLLARRLFVEGLGVGRVFFADPPRGTSDGFLLTAERTPNLRGAQEAGFSPRPPDLEGLKKPADVLIVFGHHLTGVLSEEALAGALGNAGTKVLLSAKTGPLDRLFDVVIPIAVPAEKAGTFINVDGIRQSFGRGVDPLPGVPAESDILVLMAHSLGLGPGETDAR
jgi:NADH-quinone oxidoreductase subunit G